MNEIEFKCWLIEKKVEPKVQSDIISRLKRIEREINHCDIDDEYRNDKCENLISLFRNKGNNNEMKMYGNVQLPIGKYSLSTYKLALTKYIAFLEETNL